MIEPIGYNAVRIRRRLEDLLTVAERRASDGDADAVDYHTSLRRLRAFLVSADRDAINVSRWGALMQFVIDVVSDDETLFHYIADEFESVQFRKHHVRVLFADEATGMIRH